MRGEIKVVDMIIAGMRDNAEVGGTFFYSARSRGKKVNASPGEWCEMFFRLSERRRRVKVWKIVQQVMDMRMFAGGAA